MVSSALQQALSSDDAIQSYAKKRVESRLNDPSTKQAQEDINAASGAYEKAVSEKSDREGAYAKSLDAAKFDAAPKKPELSDEPVGKVTDPLETFKKAAPVLAMLGGLFIKSHAMGAMEAATSAIEATKTNDADALKIAHDNWINHNKKLLDQWNVDHEAWRDGIDTMKDNMSLGLSKLNAHAAAVGDKKLALDIANGNLANIMSRYDMIDKSAKELKATVDHVEEMHLKEKEISARFAEIAEQHRYHNLEAAKWAADRAEKLKEHEDKLAAAGVRAPKEVLQNLESQYKVTSKAYQGIRDLATRTGPISAALKKNSDGSLAIDAATATALIDIYGKYASARAAGTAVAQVRLIEKTLPPLAKTQAAFNALFNPNGNTVLTKETAKQFLDVINKIEPVAKDQAERDILYLRNQAVKNNANPDAYSLIPGFKLPKPEDAKIFQDDPTKPNGQKRAVNAVEYIKNHLNDSSKLDDFEAAYGGDELHKLGLPTHAERVMAQARRVYTQPSSEDQ